MLDMLTMTWTLIMSDGPGPACHSLSPFGLKRFLLVGGRYSEKEEVWILDADEKKAVKCEDPLPMEKDAHRTIEVKTEKGLSLYCLGGRESKDIVVFDIE